MDSVLPEEWRDGTVLARLAAVRDESAAKRAAIEFCRAVRTNWNFTAAEVRFDARPAPMFRIFGASNCPARVSLVQITSADTRVRPGCRSASAAAFASTIRCARPIRTSSPWAMRSR